MSPSRFASLACLFLLSALPARGVDYVREVKPVLVAHCYACHGALQQKGGLRLDTVALMKEGGENGPVVVAGKSAASPLVRHVTATGRMRMPPASEGDPLKKEEVAALRAWIDAGAAGPADEKPEADPKDHWAFRTPTRPPLPRVKDPAWVRNPVDAFIAAERDRRGLVPQRPAERRILLRRVTLDLIGLPPTAEETAAFLADDSPRAYERVVERLLSSPRYGERWGRHWMDVWRYSDWWGLGSEVRNSQKHIWHWRDWIVESVNADAGYDQMVREMLAADELYPTDAGRLRGTGFLARAYFKFNRNTWMEEVVEHTSKAFLGLTVNCAKCHDHKYDPIAQEDFYRFRAFFEPYQIRADPAAGEIDFEKDGVPRVFDCNLSAPTFLFVRGDEKNPRKKPILPGLPRVFGARLDIRPVALPLEAYTPGANPAVLGAHLRQAESHIQTARMELAQAKRLRAAAVVGSIIPPPTIGSAAFAAWQLEHARYTVDIAERTLAVALLQPDALKVRAAADWGRTTSLSRAASLAERRVALALAEAAVARAEFVAALGPDMKRVEAGKNLAAAKSVLANARKALETQGETYTPLRGALKTPESNTETPASRNKPFPATSTGRRSALARWMTGDDNPLTARVAVNHIWLRHFGKPLVPTVFDFGRKGTPPTHPELLDWLAVELRESGWSMKHVHRLIVTSSTYRMTSSGANASANRSIDPENRAYWRMNSVRMESQAVRDSLLSLSGDLDSIVGGPPVPVSAPTTRRSLYFVHSHNDQQKFLSLFDDASVLECYRRAESILPQQALALQNSRLAAGAAEKIAARLDTPGRTDETFVRAAFETILGQTPTADEQAECVAALRDLRALAEKEKRPGPARAARTSLVHALLNHNDFVTIR